MGKGSRGELGEGRKGVRPNSPAEGEGCWNGGSEVGETGRWEDGWSDGEEGSDLCPSTMGEVDGTGMR